MHVDLAVVDVETRFGDVEQHLVVADHALDTLID